MGKIRIFLEKFWEKSEFFWENFRKSQDIFGKILDFFWENQDFFGKIWEKQERGRFGNGKVGSGVLGVGISSSITGSHQIAN